MSGPAGVLGKATGLACRAPSSNLAVWPWAGHCPTQPVLLGGRGKQVLSAGWGHMVATHGWAVTWEPSCWNRVRSRRAAGVVKTRGHPQTGCQAQGKSCLILNEPNLAAGPSGGGAEPGGVEDLLMEVWTQGCSEEGGLSVELSLRPALPHGWQAPFLCVMGYAP